jgi:hypothetical protein
MKDQEQLKQIAELIGCPSKAQIKAIKNKQVRYFIVTKYYLSFRDFRLIIAFRLKNLWSDYTN